jgi:phosphoglycerol transferase MdoB-like AlkP superfamily enzyme
MVKTIFKRLVILNAVFILLMTVYRIIFTVYYSGGLDFSIYLNDLFKAFFLGFRYDFAVIAYINAAVTLSFIVIFFINSKNVFVKFVKTLKYYYMFLFGGVISILCIDFGFYSYFQNHINILIFGVFEDDTKALFSTLAENYPLILVAVGFLSIFLFVFFMTKFILEKNIASFELNRIKIKYKILLSLLLISLNFISARGSFGLFPLGVDNAEVSDNNFINQVSINAIYTLQAALEARSKENRGMDYIAKMGYAGNIDKAFSDYLSLSIQDIPKDNPEKSLIRVTKYNKNIEEIKPNVIVIVMESLGTDLMHYNSPDFNVLGEFKKHLDEDIVFYRFLPGHMGTIGSLESVITNIVRLPLSKYLCQSKYAYNKYFYSGPMPYKNKGYEAIFLYGGNAGWRNVSSYMPNLGFDKIIGEGSMPKDYERNQWGVYDEYLFDRIFNLLGEGGNKKFIYALTTSNHPPYSLPSNYKSTMPLKLSPELEKSITGDMKLSKMRFATYQYSCQKVGEFLTRLKKSKYADNTIVAITGDHNFWSTFTYPVERKLDAMSVPFYLYIPKKLMPARESIDTSICGSHSDIMPTVYGVSLSSTSYCAMGTDLFSRQAGKNTASNDSGLIMNKDFALIYDFASNTQKYYVWNKDKSREIVLTEKTQEHENMLKHYKSAVAIAQYMLKNEKGKIK